MSAGLPAAKIEKNKPVSVIPWHSIAAWIVTLATGAAVWAGGMGQQEPASPVLAYDNGRWFTGSAFALCRMYTQGGRFIESVDRPDSVIDLGGGYVVPPFGEGHNHNTDLRTPDPAHLEATFNSYRKRGSSTCKTPTLSP